MGVIVDILSYTQLGEAIAATGTFDSVAAAIESGVVTVAGDQAVGGFAVIQGGAAAKVISLADSALEVAQSAELTATAANAGTGAVTVATTASGAKLMGLMTMDLGLVATAAAPLAGVALGSEIYKSNPSLWTKISQTLLPFCYAENKIQAFLDYTVDSVTGKRKPVVLIATAIIDALKNLFNNEVSFYETTSKTDSLGRSVSGVSAEAMKAKYESQVSYHYEYASGNAMVYPDNTGRVVYQVGECYWHIYDTNPEDYTVVYQGPGFHGTSEPGWGLGTNPYTQSEVAQIVNDPEISPQYFPPTAGVSAPTVPVEPTVWPDTPIIVVPDPLGPDYQPIPVTPVTPLLPPAPETPLLPEHVPDPTPDAPPEEWPEEEPWPTVIPFPVQPTEPTPDWPEVMPWPLPSEPPEEWPTTPWPSVWPEELPWPRTPEEWPETVPWPEVKPEEWPETKPAPEPWPDSPEEWPEEIPWPVP